jgi:uncharacterized linocin/CFP29 family protein
MKNIQNSRNNAPFDVSFWSMIDHRVVETAKKRLCVRKLLETEGPLKDDFLMTFTDFTQETLHNGIEFAAAQGTSLVYLYTKFSLSAFEIDYMSKTGFTTGLQSLVDAVAAITSQEDQLLLNGKQHAGISGILNAQGTHTISFPRWDSPGAATETILAGIELLDRAGIRGSYSLALDPTLYTQLFRISPQTGVSEIDNITAIVNDGVVKCDSLEDGGILMASGNEYASIILGQDLITGYESLSGLDYTFTLSESFILKLNTPKAICLLKTSQKN